jgi:hypothetical protein
LRESVKGVMVCEVGQHPVADGGEFGAGRGRT